MVFVTARFAVLALFVSLAAISQNPLSVDAAAIPRSDVTNTTPAVREKVSVVKLPHHPSEAVSQKGKKKEDGKKKGKTQKHEKGHKTRFASPDEEPVTQAYFDLDGTSTHVTGGRDHHSEHARAHGGHGSHRTVIVDRKSNHARFHRRSPDHDHDHDHVHEHDHDHDHDHDHEHEHDHDHHRRFESASGNSFVVSPVPNGHSRRSPQEFTEGNAPEGTIDLVSCGKKIAQLWVNETTEDWKAEPSSKNQTTMYLVETGDNGAYKNVQLQLPFTDPKEAKRLAYCLTYCTGQPEEELYVSPCEPTPDACSQTFLYNGTDRSILPMNPGSSTTSGSSAETADVGDSEEDDGDEAYSTAIERRNETSTNVTMVFVPSGPVANDTEDASAEDDSDVSTVTVTETRTATVTATVTGDSTAVTTPTSVDSSSVPSVTSSSLKVEVYAPNAVAGSGSASSLEAASSTMDAPPSTSTDPVQVSSDSPISSAVSSTTSSTATVAARSQVTAASTEPYKWRFARK